MDGGTVTSRRAAKSPKKKVAKPKPAPILDDVFFHKSQVRIGTAFVYMGRMDPLSVWTVVDVHTFARSKNGWKRRRAEEVAKLKDEVVLHREGGQHKSLQLSFQYMSYSAIWRMRP